MIGLTDTLSGARILGHKGADSASTESSNKLSVEQKEKRVVGMGRNVFLSFAMEDKTLVDLFRRQIKNKRLPLNFRDHSIKEPFDSAWKTKCEEKIRRSSVTICLVGPMTYKSDAVNWEIRKSIELGKGIVAVYLTSEQPTLPEALKEYSVKPVNWNSNEIMNEIRRVAQ